MITQYILNFFSGLVEWLVGLIPVLSPQVSEAIQSLPSNVADLAVRVSALSPVIPFEQINVAFGLIAVSAGVALSINVVLRIISYLTMGGGAV